MKYLKKFNESIGNHEILDYFSDLEDRGVIEIDQIVNTYPSTILDVIMKGNQTMVGAADVVNKYLEYFSIRDIDGYVKYSKSKNFTPLKSLYFDCNPNIDISKDLDLIISKCNDSNGNIHIFGSFYGSVLSKGRRVGILFIEI
jgi:hypothetical protein